MADTTRMLTALAALVLACSSQGCSREPAGTTAKVPATPVAERLDRLQECSLEAARTAGDLNAATYARRLLALGVLDELRTDAQSIAGEQIAQYNAIASPTNGEGQVRNYLAALGDVSFVETHDADRQLKARAYLAYYESKFTGDECPLDADILQLINKPTT